MNRLPNESAVGRRSSLGARWVFLAALAFLACCGSAELGAAEKASRQSVATRATDPLQTALDRLGLTRETLRFKQPFFDAQGADLYLSRVFPLYQTQPLEIPYLLSHARLGAIEKPSSLHMTMQGMLTKVDARVRRGVLDTNPLAEIEKSISSSSNTLAESLVDVYRARDERIPLRELARLRKAAGAIPRDIQDAAALVLRTSVDAAQWQRRAFARCAPLLTRRFVESLVLDCAGQEENGVMPEEVERVVEQTDFPALHAGAEDLALAVDKAQKALAGRKTTETLSFDWPTPLGRVVVLAGSSPTPDYGPETPILLWFDMDGDDVHRAGGGNLSPQQPVSILMDFGGNDRYEAGEKTTRLFGAGTFGYGIVVDTGGDDVYECGALTQGSGLFGFGALLDMGGNDTYKSVVHAQGAGSFGLGLLVDLGGSDSYEAFTKSQGFGFTKGCGHLIDMGNGNDHYVLRNDKILFPAAQSPKEHNSSCGQGFGEGLRGDLADGHSWAGGYGLLVDEGGDDTYSAAVFAQGSAYWYGLGFLIDGGGNDTYDGYWYCQGAAAHFAVAGLIDYAGNDHYKCGAQVAQGAAHDWSVAWLVDAGGNDVYEAGDLSLGAANMNSIGIFLDVKGDDRYRVSRSETHSGGAARMTAWGTLREAQMNAGIFLDCGGRDTYEGIPGRDNSVWRSKMEYSQLNLPSEFGVGVDAETSGTSPVRLEPYTEKPPEEK